MAVVELTADEMVEQLYNFDRKDLRKIAWEALLISDGPDSIEGNVDDAAVAVVVNTNGVGTTEFTIFNWTEGRELL